MFYAKLRKPHPTMENLYYTQNNLYHDHDLYFQDTFSPEVETLCIIEFKSHGKTYQERKQSVKDIAINFFDAQCEQVYDDLSYSEIRDIYLWLEKMAKNYGLIQEFRENGII